MGGALGGPAAAVATAQKVTVQKSGGKAPTSSPGPVVVSVTTTDPALNPFLQCVVQAESGGDYQAVSPNGLYMGAFQFSQATWNMAAPSKIRSPSLARTLGKLWRCHWMSWSATPHSRSE